MSWMPVSRPADEPDETDWEQLYEDEYNAECDKADDAWSERLIEY